MSKHSRTYSRILLAKLSILKIEFTFKIRNVLVGILLYMHGSLYCGTWKGMVKYVVMLYVARHVRGETPHRLHVILIGGGYIVEKRYMHGSCQFHQLYMPLHAT